MALFVFSFVLSVSLCHSVDGATMSVDSLVEANESALGLIHKIELSLAVTVERFKPDHFGPHLLTEFDWAQEGERERIRYFEKLVEPREDGLPNDCGDMFRDGTSTMYLRNWDPARPQQLAPENQGSVRASIQPYSREIPALDVKSALLLTFNAYMGPSSDRRYSLRELVEESMPAAILKGKTDVSGHQCWQIHTFLRFPSSTPPATAEFDIFLDPAVNFGVRRADIVEQDEAGWVRVVRDVTEFKNCGDGVFVPMKVTTWQYYPNVGAKTPYSAAYAVVNDLVVNQPLSDDAFDFRFPAYALVKQLTANQGRYKVELWGPDNRPLKEIRNPSDLKGVSTPSAGHRSMRRLLMWSSALVLGIGVLALAFRRFMRAS